jgi:hypothetical protein
MVKEDIGDPCAAYAHVFVKRHNGLVRHQLTRMGGTYLR